jgi:micrococcal nuclease
VAPSMAGGEPIPCLLAGGLSFAPVDLFPEALRVKITDSPPPFAIEGLKFIPLRRFANALSAPLTWHSHTQTITMQVAGGPVHFNALPGLRFWKQSRIRTLSSFAPVTVEAKCVRAVDGDTIQLDNGEKVRYIGMDTPETKHPHKPVQVFGHEASAANRKLVEGRRVTLEYDVEKRDRYQRLLAYVHVGEVFVNAALLAEGYAQTSTYPPNVRYADMFSCIQRSAREGGKGLWGAEHAGDNTVSRSVGKYLGNNHSHIYHYPTCRWAQKISPQNAIWFESAAAARKAGYRACRVCKPPQ